jgi:hypothetical protein
LMSIGQKSDDGKRFIKSDQISLEFTQSPAYSKLFVELGTDAEKIAEFIIGCLPRELGRKVEENANASRPPTSSPMPPPPPAITNA